MIHKVLLVMTLLIPADLTQALMAAPIRPSPPARPSVNQLRWQIIGLPKGGKGSAQVLDYVVGSESDAEYRAAYWRSTYSNMYVTYRLAR